MKICFIASQTSVHTLRWLKAFADRGHEMHIITFSPAKIDGVIVHSLNARFSFSPLSKIFTPLPTLLELRFIPKIKKILKEIKPDILHGHYLTCYAFFAACAGFHPLVVSAWGSDVSKDPEKSKITKSIVQFVLRKADSITMGDELGKKRIMELGADSRKIYINPWGTDTSRFSSVARSQSLKQKLDTIHNYSIINIAALSNPDCHVDVFVRAMPIVLRDIPNVKFIVVVGHGSRAIALKRLAATLGTDKNILFFERIPATEMPQYLASADIYVDAFFLRMNQLGSGLGISTLEAMSCSVPPILAKRPEFTELGEKFPGFTFEPNNPADLAGKIIYLLKNEKLRQEIGQKSREFVLEIGDWNINVQKMEQMYQNLIKLNK